MTVAQLSDDDALALNGTTDSRTALQYPELLQARWAEAVLRGLYQIQLVTLPDLRVVEIEDNADAVGVLAGFADVNGTLYAYAGATGANGAIDGLTDNDTTYIWAAVSAGSLVIDSAIDATGWPATDHVKLAKVTMAGGVITDIDDVRGAQAFRHRRAAAVADLNQTIAGPSVAEVQAISDKVDELLANLRSAGLLAT